VEGKQLKEVKKKRVEAVSIFRRHMNLPFFGKSLLGMGFVSW
jgi:hypothetical protein